MVGSWYEQLVEELKKWIMQSGFVIARKSLMVEVAGTKVVEDIRLLISNILVSLVPCPFHMGLLITEPFLVSILVAHSS